MQIDDDNQHSRTPDFDPRELQELRTLFEGGVARINARIDHVIGRHDFAPQAGCPGCSGESM